MPRNNGDFSGDPEISIHHRPQSFNQGFESNWQQEGSFGQNFIPQQEGSSGQNFNQGFENNWQSDQYFGANAVLNQQFDISNQPQQMNQYLNEENQNFQQQEQIFHNFAGSEENGHQAPHINGNLQVDGANNEIANQQQANFQNLPNHERESVPRTTNYMQNGRGAVPRNNNPYYSVIPVIANTSEQAEDQNPTNEHPNQSGVERQIEETKLNELKRLIRCRIGKGSTKRFVEYVQALEPGDFPTRTSGGLDRTESAYVFLYVLVFNPTNAAVRDFTGLPKTSVSKVFHLFVRKGIQKFIDANLTALKDDFAATVAAAEWGPFANARYICDGTHIPFEAQTVPAGMFLEANTSQMRSYKLGKSAINFQVLLGPDGRAAYVDDGNGGTCHDFRAIYRWQHLHQIADKFANDNHFPLQIMADKGYIGLSPNQNLKFFTPHKGQNLNPQQKQFNEQLSHYRVRIEHFFGWLKYRFAILRNYCRDLRFLPKLFKFCVALLNVCLEEHDLNPIYGGGRTLEQLHEANMALGWELDPRELSDDFDINTYVRIMLQADLRHEYMNPQTLQNDIQRGQQRVQHTSDVREIETNLFNRRNAPVAATRAGRIEEGEAQERLRQNVLQPMHDYQNSRIVPNDLLINEGRQPYARSSPSVPSRNARRNAFGRFHPYQNSAHPLPNSSSP